MLAYILAVAVTLGSFALYMAAFFFPEVHRKGDFTWSGVGLFYALILWACAGRITGAVLLGQVASVALIGWFGWQTVSLRRAVTPETQKTPIPDAVQQKVDQVLTPSNAPVQAVTETVQEGVKQAEATMETAVDQVKAVAETVTTEIKENTNIEEQLEKVTDTAEAVAETVTKEVKTLSQPEQRSKSRLFGAVSGLFQKQEQSSDVKDSSETEVEESAPSTESTVTETDDALNKSPFEELTSTSPSTTDEISLTELADAVEKETEPIATTTSPAAVEVEMDEDAATAATEAEPPANSSPPENVAALKRPNPPKSKGKSNKDT